MPKAIRIIDGKEVELDREIADLIVLMNERGYKTVMCCSGDKIDHPNNEYEPDERWNLRPFIHCDFGQDLNLHQDKILILMKCLIGIGHIELVEYWDEPGIATFMIEFNIRCPTHIGRSRLTEFHKRFKELTDAKYKIQKQA